MRPDPATVRPREAADVPALARLLGEQQALTGYPVRWPLPFPAEEFVVRGSEVAAWVAVDGADVVGHVSLLDLAPGWDTDAWVAATGLPPGAMAAVGVLFVDPACTGRGVGSTLLAAAVGHARELGRTPVLDVVQETPRAVELYRRHGWQVVGAAGLAPGRPPPPPPHGAARLSRRRGRRRPCRRRVVAGGTGTAPGLLSA
ncbi:GNAT family N-acetyltransferase [Oryzobacter telluris]|uniref:GNAT family N-acetyltransferase n=1 Tax=Oryzobacter telluris TaxID=3149179 RepID=UPI00370D626E